MSKLGWHISLNKRILRPHVVSTYGYGGKIETYRHLRINNLVPQAQGSASSEEDGGRLADLFKKYKSQQEEEGSVYVGSTVNKDGKKRRHRSKSLYTKGEKENEMKHGEYFYRVSDGTWRPRVGVHGKGEPRWWALRVTIGREKQTCSAIERRYQQLIEAAPPEDVEMMQEIETWDIWKRVKAWNPKSGKMGNKMIRYDGGGWILLRAIMDGDIANILRGNINILGFHHREVYNGEEFPIPVEDTLLAEMTEWQEDLQPILEEQVRQEMGLPPPIPEDQYFDFDSDKQGRSREKKDRGKREGLFSSHDDDTWGESSNAWYSGSLISDEGGMVDTDWLDDKEGALNVQKSNKKEDINVADELSSWLGDFGQSTNDGWGSLDDGQLPSTNEVDSDDLAWWDDATSNDENVDRSQLLVSTDEDQSTTSYATMATTDNDCLGAPIEVVRGAFKDFEGIILEDNSTSDKVKAEIDVFGKPTIVEVLREDLEYL